MTVTNTSNQQPNSLKHSPRFDELSVVLPEHIEQPTLKQLVQRVQHASFIEEDADNDTNEKSYSVEKRHSNQKDEYLNDNKQIANETINHKQSVHSQDLNLFSHTNDRGVAVDGGLNHDGHLNKNSTLQFGEINRAHQILQLLETTEIADASVLVLITNEDNPKLLLTRRAAHLNSHAGEVSFAGGKYERGDGNNIVTALREACEETALPPNKVQIVGQLPTQMSKKGLNVRPIVALVTPPVTYVPELGEIERIFWAELEELIVLETTEYVLPYRNAGRLINLKTPSWHVDGEIVWGLTGRIVASLLEIAFDRTVEWYYQPADIE